MHAACFSSPDTTKAAPAHANTRSQTCCNPRHLVSKSGCLLLPSRRDLPSYLLLLRRLLLRSTAFQIKLNAAGRELQASCCASCKLRCPLLCFSSDVLSRLATHRGAGSIAGWCTRRRRARPTRPCSSPKSSVSPCRPPPTISLLWSPAPAAGQ